MTWDRLDGFTKGFITALVATVGGSFDDLSPAALARIMADCEAFQMGRLAKPARMVFGRTPPSSTAVLAVLRGAVLLPAGAWFFASRQGLPGGFSTEVVDGSWGKLLHALATTFPALVVDLDDAGLITLKDKDA